MRSVHIHPKANRLPTRRALALCAAAIATGITATGAAARSRAHAAHTQNVTDTAHLHYLRSSGANLLEEGQTTGALPGRVQVRLNIGATVFGTFTISTRYGSISGEGSGKVHGTGIYASFGGSMTATHGTGRFARVSGHGGFYGVINRHTFAATVQTTGTLSY
jgi:hypothetical protein